MSILDRQLHTVDEQMLTADDRAVFFKSAASDPFSPAPVGLQGPDTVFRVKVVELQPVHDTSRYLWRRALDALHLSLVL